MVVTMVITVATAQYHVLAVLTILAMGRVSVTLQMEPVLATTRPTRRLIVQLVTMVGLVKTVQWLIPPVHQVTMHFHLMVFK